jgi:translation initiation factor IF-2
MQQRQLRLGDILDDYCPRERRVTNHVVVAMVGDDVKQTRCTTCDAEHEYKHAKVPRQRRKNETPAALYSQVLANGPKRVAHEDHEDASKGAETAAPMAVAAPPDDHGDEESRETLEPAVAASGEHEPPPEQSDEGSADENADADSERDEEDGPIHRRLIRASLPRPEGQQPPARPIPEFTIRQPGGRPNRFRPRHQRGPGGGGQQFGGGGNRSNGNVPGGPPRGGGMRSGGGRPPQGAVPQRMSGRRHGPGGRKRSK